MTHALCVLLRRVRDSYATELSDEVDVGVLADGQRVTGLLCHFTWPAASGEQRADERVTEA
jgi:hypothetical protein